VSSPRILLIDIENSAHTADVWALFDQTIPLNMVNKTGHVMCYAYQWYDENKVKFSSEFHDGHGAMVRKAWDLLNEADLVVHFNGNRHDIPHLNSEFFRARLGPPSPYRNVDLLPVVRSNFKFVSNKLDHVLTEAGLPNKVKHSGYGLWQRCLDGDPKAWAEMKKYCMGDVKPLRELYEMLRPWIKNHPHIGGYTGSLDCCPKCGSDRREKRGFAHSPAGAKYQQFHCLSCNAWYRGSKALEMTTTRGIA
jgi:uncharacterized protein YprB with RNaseH-like and TPR domain